MPRIIRDAANVVKKKVPFPAQLAVSHEIRNKYMEECAKHNLPQLIAAPRTDRLSIVCFGPTLHDTWSEVKHPALTVSGAHDFMIERGFVPEYHMDCDPRPHKVKFTEKPHKDVTYLMASCCDPKVWENLKGFNVKVWHMHNGKETTDWVSRNAPWSAVVGGGSTAGLRAIQIGGILGFRKFDIYGMDCSSVDGELRAGESNAPPQNKMRVRIKDRIFDTTDLMINAATEYLNHMEAYPMIDCVLHGDGFLQNLVKNK